MNHNLSADNGLNLHDADVFFFPDFLSQAESKLLLDSLTDEISWEQQQIEVFGKERPVPRLTAWYGDPGKDYTYSGITQKALPWTASLLSLKERIESFVSSEFNSVLLNLYRDGSDSVSWHSDDEPELGTDPVIASVSLGATRRFHFKHKTDKELRHSMDLNDGSLLLMAGATQHCWLHQIPKTKRKVGPRINLTFRTIHTVQP